jgi:cytochrome P450
VHLSVARLEREPLEVWQELRSDAPVAHVPELGLTLVTRWQDVDRVCRDTAVFSAETTDGPLSQTLGANFMHADGEEHLVVRQHLVPLLRAGAMRERHEGWLRDEAQRLTRELGQTCDVMAELAHPLASALLSRITGVAAAEVTFERWFRALAAGVGNFEGDDDKHRLAQVVCDEIDEAVRSVQVGMVPELLRLGLTFAQVSSTVKLFIIGGLQEPRDLLGFTVWGMAESGTWGDPSCLAGAIEEAARWGSPVGTVTRTVVTDTELSGHHLVAGTRVAAVLAAANHDPDRWGRPERFDPARGEGAHAAFSAGPHACVGAAASRLLVRVALQELMRAAPSLSLVEMPTASGYEFRGPNRVLVSR